MRICFCLLSCLLFLYCFCFGFLTHSVAQQNDGCVGTSKNCPPLHSRCLDIVYSIGLSHWSTNVSHFSNQDTGAFVEDNTLHLFFCKPLTGQKKIKALQQQVKKLVSVSSRCEPKHSETRTHAKLSDRKEAHRSYVGKDSEEVAAHEAHS